MTSKVTHAFVREEFGLVKIRKKIKMARIIKYKITYTNKRTYETFRIGTEKKKDS